jgi:LPS sulfotransferase NodH
LKGIQVIFLCFTNRVGSNYLTDLLSLAGYGVRVAEEDYNSSTAIAVSKRHKINDYDAYLEHLVRTTARNGTCVWKIGPAQLLWLANRGFVPDFFPDARYIHIRRRNKIAQAVSLFLASQTGKYFGDTSENGNIVPVDNLDASDIARHLLQILIGESHLEYFFALHNLKPYELWYEDLAAAPQSSILKLSEWLGYADASWLTIDSVDENRSLIKSQHSRTNDVLIEKMRSAFALTPKS